MSYLSSRGDIRLSCLGVAVNPWANTVYVANSDDNTVSLISAKTNKVTSTVAVGNSPAELAVSSLTATVYVTDFRGSSVSVITN